jgi:putative addiction module component (TIGR02574 family)
MNLQEIEQEVLYLSKNERAQLAKKILLSLDSPSEKELEQEWLLVAKQRAKDLDNGNVKAVPAEEVRRKAMTLLK